MLIKDETFYWGKLAYKKASLLKKSKCRIRIYKNSDDRSIIIVTELPDNKGRSITNDAELIIKLASLAYQLSPTETMWVEHYTEPCRIRGKEHFDIVYLEKDTARWKPSSPEEIEKLIGEDPRVNK